MRNNRKVSFPLPVLRRVHLFDIVIPYQRRRNLGELNLGNVLSWTTTVTCSKLCRSVSMCFQLQIIDRYETSSSTHRHPKLFPCTTVFFQPPLWSENMRIGTPYLL
jgi:hypothetical protein